MKDKYIYERFRPYFVFGTSGDQTDLSDGVNLTVATMSHEHAERIIRERDECIDMLIRLAQKLEEKAPEDFHKIWYANKPS